MVARPRQLPLPIDYAPPIVRGHGLRDAHSRPLVSNGKREGGGMVSFRVAPEDAWSFESIELRTGNSWPVMVFDLDGRHAFDRVQAATARGLLHPNWVTLRERSGGVHVVYTLNAPVHRGAGSRERPLLYLARVSEWYAAELDADAGYGGVLSHNPVPPPESGLVTTWGREAPYELRELAAVIPKGWRRPHLLRTAIGRNVALFEAGMRWAGSPANVDLEVLPALRIANRERFAEHPAGPLPDGEVRSTAKSIERYRVGWIAQGRFYTAEEREAWGRRRGEASGRARRERNAERDAAIIAAANAGASEREIAALHGISRGAVAYTLRRGGSRTTQVVSGPAPPSAFRELQEMTTGLVEMFTLAPYGESGEHAWGLGGLTRALRSRS